MNSDENLSPILERLLCERGRRCTVKGVAVLDLDTNLSFRPLLADARQIEDSSFRTCTTIEIVHPISSSQTIYEFQHAQGGSLEESIVRGLTNWIDLDLPPVVDSVGSDLKKCPVMEMDFPGHSRRRVILGPVMLWGGSAKSDARALPEEKETHPPFCACCMFVNCMTTFSQLVKANELYAIRLFATRMPDGTVMADCRVNGKDYQEGKDALLAYARTWSDGFQSRKQYVIIQNAVASPAAAEVRDPTS